MASDGGHQGVPVLADLRIPALGEGYGLSALGGNLLIQHRPARFAVGGTDQTADLLALFYVADQVQGGIVHLAKLIHRQDPFQHPGHIVHDVAVPPVKGRGPLCYQVQVKIPIPLVGQAVQQGHIQAVTDALGLQVLVKHIPGQICPRPHRRENHQPGVQLVGGEEKPGAGVQHQSLFFLALRFFLAVLAPASALCRFQTGGANVFQ